MRAAAHHRQKRVRGAKFNWHRIRAATAGQPDNNVTLHRNDCGSRFADVRVAGRRYRQVRGDRQVPGCGIDTASADCSHLRGTTRDSVHAPGDRRV